MLHAGALIAAIAIVWALFAGVVMWRSGLNFRQALLYVPLKFAYRIRDNNIRAARDARAPVIYTIAHGSRLDPGVMLSLLPPETLHILDEASARSAWLEPWRELARTIAFNERHVFVSRRLVRHLKGNGRIAVYFPDSIEPGTKAFRLYRAVARIAARSEAKIVAVAVRAPSRTGEDTSPRFMGGARANALSPLSLDELVVHTGDGKGTAAQALYARVTEAAGLETRTGEPAAAPA